MDKNLMTDERFIGYIERGSDHYFSMLGNIRGSENHSRGNVNWTSGHVECTYSVKLRGPDYIKEIEEIIKEVEAGDLPGRLIFMPDSAPPGIDICELFLSNGNFTMGTDYGMAKELYPCLLFPMPPYNINLFKVKEVYQLKTAGSILNSAFEYDFFSFEHYLDIFNTSYAYFYIAEYNGIPAGACMALHGEGFMEIAWAGTLNGYRKKGIAGYLLNMAEKDAIKKGIPISVLSAFPGGVNAYSRVGYRKICEIKIICYNPA